MPSQGPCKSRMRGTRHRGEEALRPQEGDWRDATTGWKKKGWILPRGCPEGGGPADALILAQLPSDF